MSPAGQCGKCAFALLGNRAGTHSPRWATRRRRNRLAGGQMSGKLNLDPAKVAEARELARRAGEPVTRLATTRTTTSIERAVLRLAGLDGADPDGMPWVNRLTDAIHQAVGLEHGVALH